MKIFYFTTTGNSLDLAKQIGGELYSIVQVMNNNQKEFEDDAIGIICPDYMGGIPEIVVEFLEEVKLKSNYFFGVITYGKMSMGVTDHFISVARSNGINPDYVTTLLTVDNVIHYFDMEKEVSKIKDKRIDENIDKIVSEIRGRKKRLDTTNWFKRYISKRLLSSRKTSLPILYKSLMVETKCNRCGTCTKVCPVGNVRIDKVAVIGTGCIGCYACTHNCPENVIRVKGEKSIKRYRNERISLNEIIESNCNN